MNLLGASWRSDDSDPKLYNNCNVNLILHELSNTEMKSFSWKAGFLLLCEGNEVTQLFNRLNNPDRLLWIIIYDFFPTNKQSELKKIKSNNEYTKKTTNNK